MSFAEHSEIRDCRRTSYPELRSPVPQVLLDRFSET
jgi:hypothetical protein